MSFRSLSEINEMRNAVLSLVVGAEQSPTTNYPLIILLPSLWLNHFPNKNASFDWEGGAIYINICILSFSRSPYPCSTLPPLSYRSSSFPITRSLFSSLSFALPLSLSLSAVNKRLNECSKNTDWSPEDNCFSFVYYA